MSSLIASPLQPLTLSEQLDAMLSGWLERHAATRDPGRADGTAKGVVIVADSHVHEVEEFCARWDLLVHRAPRGDGGATVLVVEGRALPVQGFTEITAMFRR
jgi:hypothetical protein